MTARFLDRIHDVSAISSQIIGPSNECSVSRGCLLIKRLIIIISFSPALRLAWRAHVFGLVETQLVHYYQLCFPDAAKPAVKAALFIPIPNEGASSPTPTDDSCEKKLLSIARRRGRSERARERECRSKGW